MDLFEMYDSLPNEVQTAIDIFNESAHDYSDCERLRERLQAVGYDCDYGLDGEPEGLRRIL